MLIGGSQATEKVGEFVVGFHTVCIHGLLGFADFRTGNHAADSKPPALRYVDRAEQR